MNQNTVLQGTRNDKWFDTLHLKDGLKDRSIRGGVSTMAGQIILFLMSTAQTVILARLLLPEDYGLVAMVSSVTGFIIIFKDLGLSSAIIQREELTQSEVSSVFWVNVFISFLIALVVAVLAPAIASFYHEQRLLNITLVAALTIFIAGLSLQHNALLKRQMYFNSLALLQLVTVGLNLLIGVLLAWLGFGYWALVMQGLVLAALQTIALWILCDWRPDLTFKKSETGSFLKFGAGITGFDVVNHFSRNMDNVFIGRFVGSVALGLYSKAYQLLMLPITQLRNPLNSVAIPALSSLQSDKEKYRSFYFRYLFILAFFSMPMIVYLGVFSNELILLILGEQWADAGPIFQVLAISAFIQPVASTPSLVLITTGSVKKYFVIGVINAFFMVAGFAIGVFLDGVRGVAIAQGIVGYTLFVPVLYYILNQSPISAMAFLKEITLPAAFSVTSGIAMAVYGILLQRYNIALPLVWYCICGFIVGAFVYLTLMITFSSTRRKVAAIVEMAQSIKKK
ncbi:lipopolysaccharide biosynthesis protein [Hymenobacter profundi]|uniref:Lipopolysaccharide biosynthesis protein n=1 Tax=Hymenobacter profundi TaxID=1982110 RepID=A0ABS6WVT2_9BACT|nr:lipopolysaccharide biosynthesis protein [Hymenobacter profundi]MBW3127674.1 lipopolysaccharide biosynthesis protein [Hymenobacter profundi]